MERMKLYATHKLSIWRAWATARDHENERLRKRNAELRQNASEQSSEGAETLHDENVVELVRGRTLARRQGVTMRGQESADQESLFRNS